MPTYNRARFLPQAIESIRSQQFTDWELIVVDDGSTDETPELIRHLTASISQPVEYIRQENQGAYAARNNGLDRAAGEYIAFYDSDDVWLPHHLSVCATALKENASVDWVYTAAQVVDYSTGTVLEPSTFYRNGKPKQVLSLHVRRSRSLNIFDDEHVRLCAIEHGLACGLQCSTIRSTVFETLRFPPFRVGEDRLLVLLSLFQGVRFGYLDDVCVVYRVHDENTSSPHNQRDAKKSTGCLEDVIAARKYFFRKVELTSAERRALRRRISSDLFWQIGYSTQWQRGCRLAAIGSFLRAIAVYPWVSAYWKTLVSCSIRAGLGIGRANDNAT